MRKSEQEPGAVSGRARHGTHGRVAAPAEPQRTSVEVIRELRQRGELLEHVPGLVGLRGDTLGLYHQLELRLAALAAAEAPDEWAPPPAIAFETLAQAGYFASFPQWLTAAAHLGVDEAELEAVAHSRDPVAAAARALQPTAVALQPAVCYHAYAALRGAVLRSPHLLTTQGTCWRHEADRFAPLERGWTFTMREIVCAGDAGTVESFCRRGADLALSFARTLGLRPTLVQANDPFFAPTARGRALLQQLKALKHELLLPLGGGRTVAAASFNNHERYFGEAFDLRLTDDGSPAVTGCTAFGLERWTLAFLVEHGVDPSGWPALPDPAPAAASAARTGTEPATTRSAAPSTTAP